MAAGYCGPALQHRRTAAAAVDLEWCSDESWGSGLTRLGALVEPKEGYSCCWTAADYVCNQVGAPGVYHRGDSFRFLETVLFGAALLVEPCPVGCGALAAGRPTTTAAAAAAAVVAGCVAAAKLFWKESPGRGPSTSQQVRLRWTGRWKTVGGLLR